MFMIVSARFSNLRGVLHLLPQKASKLACFVIYLKIISIFFEQWYNNIL